MYYFKPDMEFTHYRWISGTDSTATVFTGNPSRRIFDPLNGDQVLFIINCYFTAQNNFSLFLARTVEKEICYRLPPHTKSEISVLKWLCEEITI